MRTGRPTVVLAADDGFVDGDSGRGLDGFAEEEEERGDVYEGDGVLGWGRHIWLGGARAAKRLWDPEGMHERGGVAVAKISSD